MRRIKKIIIRRMLPSADMLKKTTTYPKIKEKLFKV